MQDNNKKLSVHDHDDPLIQFLSKVVLFTVKCLSVLMVLVIIWSLINVVFHMYMHVSKDLSSDFNPENLLSIFGSFLTALIAIEIFLNIVFFLEKDTVNVPLVLATALTAVARKAIILDYSSYQPWMILSTGAIILAVGIVYWLVTKKS
jgi:uncharacterized membrane protein (DUF373 family)